MNKLISLIICLLGFYLLPAQSEGYFQQEVNYDIEVTLDDERHVLTGYIEIEYINNSSDALKEIYLHLWPNAYRTRKSAFAKQQVGNGNLRFHFADNNALGGYKDLDFSVNEEVVTWAFYEKNRDIAVLTLNKPLKSGEKITISTPLAMKIPDSFSRLGHVGQSYQITQWYPKPAVYDKDGWHPMPYLDMGEFYSEFGSFDVRITLPDNYVVGATGVLQDQSEIDFLNKKSEEAKATLKTTNLEIRRSFPPSSETTKTIQYKAENVHDFAWFADKRFHVVKDEVELASGKKVDTYVMFHDKTDLWGKAIKYVNRSVKFYSDNVGEYPWPQATAVESALSAGGGMEYPMITVIGRMRSDASLDEVITHEVGHNWFYGILASNERDYPWIDEGINSYYERRYMAEFYKDGHISPIGRLGLPKFMTNVEEKDLSMLPQIFQMNRSKHQACQTHSEKLTRANYGIAIYDKPAIIFKYLENYLGTSVFDATMQRFYEKWKFKHPQPEDIKAHFEASTGKNLDWFFDDFIKTTKEFDYQVNGIQSGNDYTLNVENVGDIAAPFPVNAYKDGALVETKWYDGFSGSQQVTFPNGDYDELRLNGEVLIPEQNQKNNNIRPKGGKGDGINFKWLGGVQNPRKTDVFWTPIVGYNDYDKFMAGLALYNSFIPGARFQYALAPMFATNSKELVGTAGLKYHLYPESNTFERVTFGLNARRFTYNQNDFYAQFDEPFFNYMRITPSITFELAKEDERSPVTHTFDIRTNWINQQTPNFNRDTTFVEMGVDTDTIVTYPGHLEAKALINEISYQIQSKDALTPFTIRVSLEQQSYERLLNNDKENYLKASLEGKYRFTYKPKKSFDIRLFTGYFITNTRREAGNVSAVDIRGSYALASQGRNDYKFNHYFFGRSDTEDIWSRQVSMDGGGFKTAMGNLSGGLGESNDFIIAFNFKVDLPMEFPPFIPKIRPYFDAGYFSNARPTGQDDTFEDQLLFNGGLALEYGDGVFGVYLPMFGSDNVMNILKQRGDFAARISFNLDLNRLNPFEAVRTIRF